MATSVSLSQILSTPF